MFHSPHFQVPAPDHRSSVPKSASAQHATKPAQQAGPVFIELEVDELGVDVCPDVEGSAASIWATLATHSTARRWAAPVEIRPARRSCSLPQTMHCTLRGLVGLGMLRQWRTSPAMPRMSRCTSRNLKKRWNQIRIKTSALV